LKQKDLRREDRGIGVAVGDAEEKSGKYEEDILPVGCKSEEAADLKKYLKYFSTYVPSLTCFLVNCFGILLFPFVG